MERLTLFFILQGLDLRTSRIKLLESLLLELNRYGTQM
jgi:hypothetical protein